jgi:hypothetical protein
MTTDMQLRVAVWFTGLAVISILAFLAWVVWQICGDVYDNLMGRWRRMKNHRLDATANRDAFRDVRGTHR